MNQRIDHNNYEAWLLDRLEGRLAPEQEDLLTAFLAAHPQLDPDQGELPRLEGDRSRLPALDKRSLKRSLPPTGAVTPATLDDHLVARSEGELSCERLEELERFLTAHPEYRRSERLMALAKVKAEPVVFPAKHDLVRELPPTGTVTAATLDDHLVALLEGDLLQHQVSALVTYLAAHPEAQRQRTHMERTRVGSAAVFVDKASLKKQVRVIPIGAARWAQRLSVAASVAVLLAVGAWYLRTPQVEVSQVAQGTTITRDAGNTPVKRVLEDLDAMAMEASETTSTADAELAEAPVVHGSRTLATVPGTALEPATGPSPNESATSSTTPGPIAEEAPEFARVEVEERQLSEHPTLHHEQPGSLAQSETNEVLHETSGGRSTTLGALLASTVRERMLDRTDESGPLNGADAVAAVDRGLKAMGGDRAGLVVARSEEGGVRSFNLRLGRNLGISASR